MRLFTQKENRIIKQLVEYKQTGNLRQLQVAPLLRKNLSFLALRWEVQPIPQVFVYTLGDGTKKTIEEATRNNYFEILDFVFFLQELEERKFIKFLSLPNSNVEKERILYDRDKYRYEPDKKQFIDKKLTDSSSILSLFGDFQYQLFHCGKDSEYASTIDSQIIPNSFAYDLDNLVYNLIYPLPIAEEYVREGFYTLEDRRFIEQKKLNASTLLTTNEALRVSKRSYRTSANSYKVAAYALIVSILFGLLQCCNDTKIEKEQFDQLINTLHDVRTATNH
ncbi:hypothetical protein [uncultured Muribaculum sp.]|jgi:hypothetical protein|uniref:hypothetical protein n=1 Tax=uncultured Muribaculum sp. TaxID=1918613 RepID=UPI002731CD67|nr:hypothetical protein [uncultured Muribaculum sp.]